MRKFLISTVFLISSTASYAGMPEGMSAYEAGDYATALREFGTEAGKNNPAGMVQLAFMYLNGEGTPRNYDYARRWLTKASDMISPPRKVWYGLGKIYLDGLGVNKDPGKASVYLERADPDDYPDTYLQRGLAYRGMINQGAQYAKKSIDNFKLAMINGDPYGAVYLGALLSSITYASDNVYIDVYQWFKVGQMMLTPEQAEKNKPLALDIYKVEQLLSTSELDQAKRAVDSFFFEHPNLLGIGDR